MMLFPAVLMNFPNSKVCLIGEWSIDFNEYMNVHTRPINALVSPSGTHNFVQQVFVFNLVITTMHIHQHAFIVL